MKTTKGMTIQETKKMQRPRRRAVLEMFENSDKYNVAEISGVSKNQECRNRSEKQQTRTQRWCVHHVQLECHSKEFSLS